MARPCASLWTNKSHTHNAEKLALTLSVLFRTKTDYTHNTEKLALALSASKQCALLSCTQVPGGQVPDDQAVRIFVEFDRIESARKGTYVYSRVWVKWLGFGQILERMVTFCLQAGEPHTYDAVDIFLLRNDLSSRK